MLNKGFTLLEVIIAVSIMTTGVIGLSALIQQTMVLTSISSSRLTASYLAQEGMEIVRAVRDGNWLKQRDNPGLSWKNDLGRGTFYFNLDGSKATTSNLVTWNYNPGKYYVHYPETTCKSIGACQDTIFNRQIEIVHYGNDMIEIKSVVSWQERGRSHQVVVQGILYNWR